MAKGRLDDAKKVLTSACKTNRQPIEPIKNLELPQNNTSKDGKAAAHLHHLFMVSGVRRNLIIMCFCWMAFAMGYFGLAYNTPSFEANQYLVFIVPAFFFIPITPIQPYFDNHFGRKKVLTFPLMVAGTVLLLTMAVPREEGSSPWPIIVMAWIGQCLCGITFAVGYIFTQELFPTPYRTSALGMASAGARFGSLCSPLIAMLDVVHPIMPLVVYGSIVLVAGILSIWLWPETAHLRFTHTMEEAEKLAVSSNSWLTCCRKQRARANDKTGNGVAELKPI